MKIDKTTNIIKQGFKEAKQRFLVMSLPLSLFALFTILSFILAYIAPYTLILTIPLLVVPSFFALSAVNTVALNQNTHEVVGFFVMFRAYFAQIFRGGYRVIIGFLKALLIFAITSTIMSTILGVAILDKDPGYIAFVENIKTITDEGQLLNAFENFVSTNQAFQLTFTITYIVSFFAASFIFLHHFAINSIKYNYNFTSKMPLPMQDLNLIHKTLIKNNKGKFYKDYFKAFWFLGLIFLVGYTGGSLIGFYFAPNANFVQISLIGLFLAFLLLLFFIPYFLCASQIIFASYRTQYIEILIDLSKQSLERMKSVQNITEEKEKEVMKIIESQRDSDENKNEYNDENK